MKMIPVLCFLLFLFPSCKQPSEADRQVLTVRQAAIVNERGQTIETRFNPPPGYTRQALNAASYGSFLRRSALHPATAMVHYYNGSVKQNPGIYAAVLTYDAGTKDLQQCADAVMRLRAEYWFSRDMQGNIHFNLTNGFRADFSNWAAGGRLRFAPGNKTSWVKTEAPSSGHASLRKYLDVIYSYAGTLSLSEELTPVPYRDMKIGDVLIIGGSPGHAVTVMDMAVSNNGKKVFLLSQSYMPAQEIQVLHNPLKPAISPWYELNEAAAEVITPQWKFTTAQLKRFPGE